MKKIDPKNLTAQLHYRAAGNPPSTVADSAISNCFPGLEFDVRNIWRRLFAGIELHEADNYVVKGEGDLQRLQGRRLLRVANGIVRGVLRMVLPVNWEQTQSPKEHGGN